MTGWRCGRRVLPITFTAVGVIALIGGLLLGSFSLRTETALTEPGLDAADHGFFGRSEPPTERVPGAEAETEKIAHASARTDVKPPDGTRRVRGLGPRLRSTRPAPETSSARADAARTAALRWSRARVRAGAGAAGGGAAAAARLSAAARRGVHAAVVSVR